MKLIIHLILRDFNSAPFYTNEPGMIATHVAAGTFLNSSLGLGYCGYSQEDGAETVGEHELKHV